MKKNNPQVRGAAAESNQNPINALTWHSHFLRPWRALKLATPFTPKLANLKIHPKGKPLGHKSVAKTAFLSHIRWCFR